jgi:hypothetical protein
MNRRDEPAAGDSSPATVTAIVDTRDDLRQKADDERSESSRIDALEACGGATGATRDAATRIVENGEKRVVDLADRRDAATAWLNDSDRDNQKRTT